ncbi:hypothetical protein RDWZM_004107 [Blomia tropicalis]|uniref:Uncharacterized protein n=1 Tax=Blomia tropicalis TaxID=40697 RepID=A0A9Q0MH16_BLOTA|nr:hypothetical protein RDWZM_004107 [Blomia tropicalis]
MAEDEVNQSKQSNQQALLLLNQIGDSILPKFKNEVHFTRSNTKERVVHYIDNIYLNIEKLKSELEFESCCPNLNLFSFKLNICLTKLLVRPPMADLSSLQDSVDTIEILNSLYDVYIGSNRKPIDSSFIFLNHFRSEADRILLVAANQFRLYLSHYISIDAPNILNLFISRTCKLVRRILDPDTDLPVLTISVHPLYELIESMLPFRLVLSPIPTSVSSQSISIMFIIEQCAKLIHDILRFLIDKSPISSSIILLVLLQLGTKLITSPINSISTNYQIIKWNNGEFVGKDPRDIRLNALQMIFCHLEKFLCKLEADKEKQTTSDYRKFNCGNHGDLIYKELFQLCKLYIGHKGTDDNEKLTNKIEQANSIVNRLSRLIDVPSKQFVDWFETELSINSVETMKSSKLVQDLMKCAESMKNADETQKDYNFIDASNVFLADPNTAIPMPWHIDVVGSSSSSKTIESDDDEIEIIYEKRVSNLTTQIVESKNDIEKLSHDLESKQVKTSTTDCNRKTIRLEIDDDEEDDNDEKVNIEHPSYKSKRLKMMDLEEETSNEKNDKTMQKMENQMNSVASKQTSKPTINRALILEQINIFQDEILKLETKLSSLIEQMKNIS